MNYDDEAIATIDDWMRVNQSEFYPNWPPVVPARAGGGWASVPIWRQDGRSMASIFEGRIGRTIESRLNELDKLRNSSLDVFRQYLARKATVAQHIESVEALWQ